MIAIIIASALAGIIVGFLLAIIALIYSGRKYAARQNEINRMISRKDLAVSAATNLSFDIIFKELSIHPTLELVNLRNDADAKIRAVRAAQTDYTA